MFYAVDPGGRFKKYLLSSRLDTAAGDARLCRVVLTAPISPSASMVLGGGVAQSVTLHHSAALPFPARPGGGVTPGNTCQPIKRHQQRKSWCGSCIRVYFCRDQVHGLKRHACHANVTSLVPIILKKNYLGELVTH